MCLQRNKDTNEPPSLIEEYARLRTYKGELCTEANDKYVSNYFYLTYHI